MRGAWVRYVRRFNPTTLGTTTDLQEFRYPTHYPSKISSTPLSVLVCTVRRNPSTADGHQESPAT